jgi:flagellar protein FliO/FliZ
MKSLTFTRGVALAGALTLTHAATAFGAASHAVTTATTQVQSSQALAQASGENTPLNLTQTAASHAAGSSSGGASIVRTIVGLFIVIAVIYGVAWILRQAKKGKTRATGNGLSQLASLPLGNGRSVALVRAGTDVVLVGVSEHSVTPIRTYTEDEVITCGIELPEEEAPDYAPVGKSPVRVLESLRRMTVRT